MTPDLWRLLALRTDYTTEGICWAWVEGRGEVCGKPEGDAPHLCNRHKRVAEATVERIRRHLARSRERQAMKDRGEAWRLDELHARLAKVEAELARRTELPDVGGVVSARQQWRQGSDTNVDRVLALQAEQKRLTRDIARIKKAVAS